MKRIFLLYVCIGLFSTAFLGALEVEVSGGLNSFTYKDDRMTPGGAFEGYNFLILNASIRHEFGSQYGFSINYVRDNITQNSINARISTRTDFFFIEFGPFFGLSGLKGKFEAGIMGTVELAAPGVLFLSIGGSSTLGSQYDFTSNNRRESAEAKLGFWLPNTILSLNATIKSFELYGSYTDKLTRFFLSADLFTKNSPFTMRIDAGYQFLEREYAPGGSRDEIQSILLGLEMNLQASRAWRIIGAVDAPFHYTPNPSSMSISQEFWKFVAFRVGLAYTFFND